MLRVLSMLLAAVALLLGIVLRQPALIALSSVVVVIIVASMWLKLGRKKEKLAESLQTKEEDLTSFGIVEIKPIAKGTTARTDESVARPKAATEASGPRLRKPEWADTPDAADARTRPEVITPFLESLRAAIDASTAVLLRQGDGALKYHIEGIASRNSFARSRGHFYTKIPLLTPDCIQQGVVFSRVGEKGIAPSNLGYYLENIAVRQIAVAPVLDSSGESATRFILADSMEEMGLDKGFQRDLIARFANLAAALFVEAGEAPTVVTAGEAGGEGDLTRSADAVAIEVTPGNPPSGDDTDPRPRREIIAEEMEAARADDRPLALALVYLRDGDSLLQQGELFLAEAERSLLALLQDATIDGRVDKFGELTYGAFIHGDAESVEAWAVKVQDAVDAREDGVLKGGISMGIVMLGERHDSPDAFRDDATEALRESFESGELTMVE